MDQDIGKSIHLLIKLLPGDLTPLLLAGYSLNESHTVRIQPRISCQYFSYVYMRALHNKSSFLKEFIPNPDTQCNISLSF